MNKYTVETLNGTITIDADRLVITANGDLKFDTQHGEFVAAMASGQWTEAWQNEVIEEVPEDKKNIT